MAATVKQREEEITGSYDAEIDKAREQAEKSPPEKGKGEKSGDQRAD